VATPDGTTGWYAEETLRRQAALLPAVTIQATDATATEAGPTSGAITVFRTGETLLPLVVGYSVEGTATNGVDYATLTGSVTLPIGAASATITVNPIDDTVVEGDETVALTLRPDITYDVGSPNSAIVTIQDDDLPALPVVTMQTTDATATEAGRRRG